MSRLIIIGLILFATLIGAFGAVFLKKGSTKANLRIKDQIKNHNLMIGIAFYVTSAILFILTLRLGDLSFIYPIVASSYIWACLLSMKMLGEKMNRYKWAGIVIIVIGVSLIGFGS